MPDPLDSLIGEIIVLDTQTPIVYIGRLEEISEHVFVMSDVDMHDCRDGHANKERYLAETREDGVTVNRNRIIVMRSVVISISRLQDVVFD